MRWETGKTEKFDLCQLSWARKRRYYLLLRSGPKSEFFFFVSYGKNEVIENRIKKMRVDFIDGAV